MADAHIRSGLLAQFAWQTFVGIEIVKTAVHRRQVGWRWRLVEPGGDHNLFVGGGKVQLQRIQSGQAVRRLVVMVAFGGLQQLFQTVHLIEIITAVVNAWLFVARLCGLFRFAGLFRLGIRRHCRTTFTVLFLVHLAIGRTAAAIAVGVDRDGEGVAADQSRTDRSDGGRRIQMVGVVVRDGVEDRRVVLLLLQRFQMTRKNLWFNWSFGKRNWTRSGGGVVM